MSLLKPWENGKKAKSVIEECQSKHKRIQDDLDRRIKDTDLVIKKLAETCQLIKEEIDRFQKLYDLINNKDTGVFGKNEDTKFGSLKDLNKFNNDDYASGVAPGAKAAATGLVAGTVTSAAAVGTTVAFGTASTGAAISSLTGFYAQNAALASLGGGALSAGGGGIAAGTVVLGSFFALPALAAGIFFWDKFGKEKLDAALKKRAQLEIIELEVLDYIKTYSLLAAEAQSCMNALASRSYLTGFNQCLEVLVSYKNDWQKYSLIEKSFVEDACMCFLIFQEILKIELIKDNKIINNSFFLKSKNQDILELVERSRFFLELKKAS